MSKPKLPGFLDQSQLSCWFHCAGLWYEKYARRYAKKPDKRFPRSDAACLGSLVHAGLEIFERDHQLRIPEWAIEENNPTPETLQLALHLMTAYAGHGEPIPWRLQWFEEPLTKRVQVQWPLKVKEEYWTKSTSYNLLAKVDYAFYVDAPTYIRCGTGTDTGELLLQPGFYIQEYKTKDASRDRGAWMAEWDMKAQADFQIMCLQEFVDSMPERVEFPVVRGVLVTVIEYERTRPPTRKCRNKDCGETQPFANYVPQGSGEYRCILCGFDSKLDPVKPKPVGAPNIWRILVTRTPEKLEAARLNAIKAIIGMHEMVESEAECGPAFNTNGCSNFYGRACDYATAHTQWELADESRGYVQIDTMHYITQGKDT